MRVDEKQIKILLDYQGRVAVKQLALSMTLAKFKRQYQEKASPEILSKCAAELNLLFERFPTLMQPDYEWIISLGGK